MAQPPAWKIPGFLRSTIIVSERPDTVSAAANQLAVLGHCRSDLAPGSAPVKMSAAIAGADDFPHEALLSRRSPRRDAGGSRQRSGGQSAGEPLARATVFACSAPVES